jgi:hypothetical protein
MRFHKIQKPKIPKHLAFDSDLIERSEEIAASESKSLNEWVNEAVRFRIETIDKAKGGQCQQSQQQLQPQPHEHPTLTLSEAGQIIRDQIIPLIEKHNLVTIEDKDNFVSLSTSSKRLLETADIKLNRRRRIEFPRISSFDPLEKSRLNGLKIVRDMREKDERVQLMSALSQPIEVMEKIDTDIEMPTTTNGSGEMGKGTGTIVLTTSSTTRLDLTEAEWLSLKTQAEERDKRLKILEEEVAVRMRAQAKDSVKLIDESKGFPSEGDDKDIPMSSVDSDEGVYDDDSEKVPHEEY